MQTESAEIFWARPPSVRLSMLLMRDEHADDSNDEVGAGELRHEETGEVYSIVYEGQGKKFKVTGAYASGK